MHACIHGCIHRYKTCGCEILVGEASKLCVTITLLIIMIDTWRWRWSFLTIVIKTSDSKNQRQWWCSSIKNNHVACKFHNRWTPKTKWTCMTCFTAVSHFEGHASWSTNGRKFSENLRKKTDSEQKVATSDNKWQGYVSISVMLKLFVFSKVEGVPLKRITTVTARIAIISHGLFGYRGTWEALYCLPLLWKIWMRCVYAFYAYYAWWFHFPQSRSWSGSWEIYFRNILF